MEDPPHESFEARGLPFAPRIPVRAVESLGLFGGPLHCSPYHAQLHS